MKRAALILLAIALVGACIVTSRSRARSQPSRGRDCPPSYHLEGGVCVHNGKGHGKHKKHKHKHRKHRKHRD